MNRNVVPVAFKTFLYLLKHVLNAFKTVPVVSWFRGLVDWWTGGLVDSCIRAFMDLWTRGLLDSWTVSISMGIYRCTYGLLNICMHIQRLFR